MRTYGQIVNGKKISFTEFQNEVLKAIKAIGISSVNPINIKKQYNKGATVDDTISYLIINSK